MIKFRIKFRFFIKIFVKFRIISRKPKGQLPSRYPSFDYIGRRQIERTLFFNYIHFDVLDSIPIDVESFFEAYFFYVPRFFVQDYKSPGVLFSSHFAASAAQRGTLQGIDAFISKSLLLIIVPIFSNKASNENRSDVNENFYGVYILPYRQCVVFAILNGGKNGWCNETVDIFMR